MNRSVLVLLPFLLVAFASLPLAAQEDDYVKAIDAIEKVGGKLKVDVKATGRPVILVDLALTSADDAVLAHVKTFKKLERLSLAGTKISDAGLQHLTDLSNLRIIALAGTKITDKGMVHLKGLKELLSLQLNSTAITDAGLVPLRGLAQLQSINLQSTSVTDEGVQELKKAIPKLKVMR